MFLLTLSSAQRTISSETSLPPCISLKHLRKVRLKETPTQMQQVPDRSRGFGWSLKIFVIFAFAVLSIISSQLEERGKKSIREKKWKQEWKTKRSREWKTMRLGGREGTKTSVGREERRRECSIKYQGSERLRRYSY